MAIRSRHLMRPTLTPREGDRIPPGQFLTQRWPILHQGSIPPFDAATWDFRVFGLVRHELRFTWEEFQALPRIVVTADMHCVTRWSKLDNSWEGVPARHVLDLAGVTPEARYVMIHADGGYTADLSLDVVAGDDVLFALRHDGEELSPEHGYPVRLVVPNRYAWKSAKWIRGVELMSADRPGFWEEYDYHPNADPWQEERFAED